MPHPRVDMRKPTDAGLQRDVMMAACGSIIGFALVIELWLLSPDNPIAAVLTVVCAGLAATACTINLLWA